jgi:UDP-N-acetylglucosamine--N-acetylmuramyl-(pentapeptide) pyrophosphoryl-undecaprenol N-acetylglucosamine transferase
MKILVAGGGSGGHVNPAISIADRLRERYPDAEFLFVGSNRGLENDLVPKAGYRLATIPVKGFSRKGSISRIGPYIVLAAGMIKSFFIVFRFKPDLAFGTGGFASGPVLFWTGLFNIPTLIHEANVFPGITNRMLSSKADIVALAFFESSVYLKKAKRIEVTGNPVRGTLLKTDREEARKRMGMDPGSRLVVAMGGSQGAAPINNAILEMLRDHYKNGDFKLVFAPGKRHYEEVVNKYEGDFRDVEIKPYIYDVETVYAAADLVINRAGAITLAEITALGIPSILIPSPYVAENHQEANARMLEGKGACRVLTENKLNGRRLYETIMGIISDREKLGKMRAASKEAGETDALDKIENLLVELAKGGG